MVNPAPAAVASDTEPQSALFWRRLGTVAAWSIVVGIALEFALVAFSSTSQPWPAVARLITQVASKVTWSFLVCLGISCGLAASRARGPVMAALGLFAGPVGFAVARSLHKGLGQALSANIVVDPTPPLWLAGLKAIEYGLLGLWVGHLSKARDPSLRQFLTAGVVVGLLCGGTGVGLFAHAKPEADGIALASRAINEVVFPIGCAFVVYMANKVSAVARG